MRQHHPYVGFNSTLVRFKPKPAKKFTKKADVFQFHFGPIQTEYYYIIAAWQDGVSIPLWSDSNDGDGIFYDATT